MLFQFGNSNRRALENDVSALSIRETAMCPQQSYLADRSSALDDNEDTLIGPAFRARVYFKHTCFSSSSALEASEGARYLAATYAMLASSPAQVDYSFV